LSAFLVIIFAASYGIFLGLFLMLYRLERGIIWVFATVQQRHRRRHQRRLPEARQ
jgi:hypothetical protein